MDAIKIRKLKGIGYTVGRQILLILVALLLATIFLAVSGYDPFAVLKGIFQSLSSDIAGTVRWATPLILGGLAICVTYKAEVFNLGVDGQTYMGAAAATAVALIIPPATNSFVSVLVVFLAAMAAGAVFALIPALLKVYLGTNEVVSTLLLNFLAELYIEYLYTGPLRDTASGTNLNASPILPENTWLPRLSVFHPSPANIGFFIALIAAAAMAFYFFKTAQGHDIKIVGANPLFAKYSGVKSNRVIIRSMMISGSIAGIIGAVEVTAVQHRLMAGFNPGFGFDGIVVSLLANNNPFGVVFAGLFFGTLKNGGNNMERLTDVPSAVTDIVMAIIIIIISAQFVVPRLKIMAKGRKKSGPDAAGKGEAVS